MQWPAPSTRALLCHPLLKVRPASVAGCMLVIVSGIKSCAPRIILIPRCSSFIVVGTALAYGRASASCCCKLGVHKALRLRLYCLHACRPFSLACFDLLAKSHLLLLTDALSCRQPVSHVVVETAMHAKAQRRARPDKLKLEWTLK